MDDFLFNKLTSDLHVLFIPASYPTTYNSVRGIFFKDQAEALANRGVKIGVLAIVHLAWEIFHQKRLDFGFRAFLENGVNVYRFQTPALPRNKLLYNDLKTIIGKYLFLKYIRKFGLPDIIHVHTFLPGDLPLWIKERFGVPFVVTEHFSYFQDGTLRSWEDRMAKRLFRASSGNFAVSQATADVLQNRYDCRVKYLPNMVDTTFFTQNDHYDSENKRRLFVACGTLNHNKNHEMLIRAFKRTFAKDEFSLFQLNIIGEGPLRGHLNRFIEENGLKHKIKLLGRLTREEVRQVFHKADFFVHSSHVETFGVSLIEAMSCGLPVLSTRCGGPESIITDESLGLLCDINEVSFAEGLKKIISCKFDRDYIRHFIIKNFSKDVIVSKLFNEYRNSLGM